MLYPAIMANATYHLTTQSGHKVYFEESGDPAGIPVLFLHGGPGSGCNDTHRRFFNPKKYRIILMDQRGCHRSSPQGEIKCNTTQDIIADMEAIRLQLGIAQWMLFAGSWGSTLALLYAQAYPQRLLAMVLRGSFLARKCDLSWFLTGAAKIFPDYWHDFMQCFDTTKTPSNIIDRLAEEVFSSQLTPALKAAKAWARWSGRVVTSNLRADYELQIEDEQKLINQTRIEMHYARNAYFIEENQILKNIHAIPSVPIRLVHGRQDLTCLPESSYLLHQALPHSQLSLLNNTGHLSNEPNMIKALVAATDELIKQL